MSSKKGISILGSTGSIGRSTIEVIRHNPSRYRIVALAAGRNVELLKEQILEFRPSFVSTLDEKGARNVAVWLKKSGIRGCLVGFGVDGASEAAAFSGAHMTVSAIVGAAGFIPTLAAVKAGKDIALANKETLVVGGALFMKEAKKRGVRVLPVDSEHSAVFQSLEGHRKADLRRIILTASGGPFLETPVKKLRSVTPDAALCHPTWDMGRRITIDSATLMNKGFEVIEAHWLFGVEPEKISVFVHPESIVHSMVEYIDGSTVAQMGSSDMKCPIAYALSYPGRTPSGARPLELAGKTLRFLEPDSKRFPCLEAAYEALRIGETAPCVVNAADEVAVDMFLKGVIKFTDIPEIISEVLLLHSPWKLSSVDDVVEADIWARKAAAAIIDKKLGVKRKKK